MRFVIQVVKEASVRIEDKIAAEIGKGFTVFIGIGEDDNKETADRMIKKLLSLRIFADENGKTNLSLADVGGGLLLVSQFTLYADCKKGNRPNFLRAKEPTEAEKIYKYIVEECKNKVVEVKQGEFGADMKVGLINDGPFTILLDSDEFR